MENFDPSLDSYFGIAQVKILPARGLYHPVLPYVSGGKLKFPLCRTCADAESKNVCRCPDAERAITGTWCTPEIVKVIEKGYVILKICEVYHWPNTTKYDPMSKTGGLSEIETRGLRLARLVRGEHRITGRLHPQLRATGRHSSGH